MGFNMVAYCRERRRQYREAGICTNCGKRPSRPGKVICEQCAYAKNVIHRQDYTFMRGLGLCPYCGRQPEPGYVTCQSCLQWHKEYREARKQAGVCVECEGTRRAGILTCEPCAKKNNARNKAYKRRLKGKLT